MNCTVYRSSKREYTYLYLANGEEWEDLPDSLREVFGEAETVMELDLSVRTNLAQEDIATVRKNLAEKGYHLQLPPTEDESGWLDLKPSP